MEHGSFLTWMLFWPIVVTCCHYIKSKYAEPVEVPDWLDNTSNLFALGFYLGVAYILY